ncbi:hypothetical protein H4219_000997 [Mycoemilia scoparia]|uniref:Uncharacterized protein n=1 Tax=Mycoemilia scoparia TaxID=417184 RepID=A0A9W8DVZ0_9FUNG|nr:hypothetical protein H4219_000997 [Mycoemilia scoparia]
MQNIKMIFKYISAIVALASGLVIKASAANNDDKSRLIVFGDSLSDIGNIEKFVSVNLYWENRLTNGPTWCEYTAALLNKTLVDYAISGSTSSDMVGMVQLLSNNLPNAIEQARLFLKLNSDSGPREGDVVVIETGANNLIYEMLNPPRLILTTESLISQITNDIRQTIRIMADGGYRRFLVMDLPDVALTPIAGNSLFLKKLYKGITDKVNQRLNETLMYFTEYYGYSLDYVKTFSLSNLTEIVSKPSVAFNAGITNIEKPCVNGITSLFPACDDEENHLFYDLVHPSAKIHYLIGLLAKNTIEEDDYKFDQESVIDIIKSNNISNVTSDNNIVVNAGIKNVPAYGQVTEKF